jgi:transcriptional regulator with XRE-family HTH domain
MPDVFPPAREPRVSKATHIAKTPAARALLSSSPVRDRPPHVGRGGETKGAIMANAIDLYVGKRLRRRRRLLGLTQQQLAESIGIRFQQIQKYECGANRVTASRLFELAVALNVPVNYFFEGLQQSAEAAAANAPANDRELIAADVLSQKETLELIRAYYKLGERPRRRLLDLAKALQDENTDAA